MRNLEIKENLEKAFQIGSTELQKKSCSNWNSLEAGKVISISDYLKQKEEPKIKKINLAQGDFEKTVSGLSAADKDIIKDLLRKSGIKVSD